MKPGHSLFFEFNADTSQKWKGQSMESDQRNLDLTKHMLYKAVKTGQDKYLAQIGLKTPVQNPFQLTRGMHMAGFATALLPNSGQTTTKALVELDSQS